MFFQKESPHIKEGGALVIIFSGSERRDTTDLLFMDHLATFSSPIQFSGKQHCFKSVSLLLAVLFPNAWGKLCMVEEALWFGAALHSLF